MTKSAYDLERERRCRWCAAGRKVALTRKQRVHYIFNDLPWKDGARPWRDEPCTAPTELQFIEELAAKVAGLDRIIELQQTSIGICAESRDVFKHENRKLRQRAEAAEQERDEWKARQAAAGKQQYDHYHVENEFGICRICSQRGAPDRRRND